MFEMFIICQGSINAFILSCFRLEREGGGLTDCVLAFHNSDAFYYFFFVFAMLHLCKITNFTEILFKELLL